MGKIVRAADYPAVHIALVNRIFYNPANLHSCPAIGVIFIPDPLHIQLIRYDRTAYTIRVHFKYLPYSFDLVRLNSKGLMLPIVNIAKRRIVC